MSPDHNLFAVFEPIVHAFADLSASQLAFPPPQSPRLPPLDSAAASDTSAAAVAQTLADVICTRDPSRASFLRVSPASDFKSSTSHNVYSKPTPSILATELAVVHGLGCWADSILPLQARLSVAHLLADSIVQCVFHHLLAPHIRSNTAQQQSPALAPRSFFGMLTSDHFNRNELHVRTPDLTGADIHVWPRRLDARRHVLLAALTARYGDSHAAPSAAMIAGAPLVLYVRQPLSTGERVTPRLASATRSTQLASTASSSTMQEWRELVTGTALFEVVNVSSPDTIRSTVSVALKHAVSSKGLSPTLVVVDADPDTTLCGGAQVLRAICDGYGARLHVEGSALALLAAGPVTNELPHNVAAFVTSSHSMILDIAAWFGMNNAAVVSFFNEQKQSIPASDMATHDESSEEDVSVARPDNLELSRVMALWFILRRINLSRCGVVMNAACIHTTSIIDCLCSIPHLIEYKTVGCGASVLLSYASVNAEAECRTAVNRAMLSHVRKQGRAEPFHFVTATSENREWLLYSPLLAFRNGFDGNPVCTDDVTAACSDLITAARRCEIATSGKAAFVACIRQCTDLEIVNLSRNEADYAPLHFGAVRVVPLGIAAGNGHWLRDADMVEQVEKYTCALAAHMTVSSDAKFEGVLHDGHSENQVPVVLVGPVVRAAVSNADGNLGRDKMSAVPPLASTFQQERSIAIADMLDISEDGARDIAREAADAVIAAVEIAMSSSQGAIGTSSDELSDNVADADVAQNDDGHMPGETEPLEHEPQHREDGKRIEGMAITTENADRLSAIPTKASSDGDGRDVSSAPHIHSTSDSNVHAGSVEDLPLKSSSIWTLLFGQNSNHVGDSGVRDVFDSDSEASIGPLEDDYFRP